ncbi:uncharacterized protein RCC_01465 [Ramularia collo-cygni]|uniref:CmcJ-like methyltransferase n=1 Tax=Ramularia collo-cygni TaxID=112498 RepID=A0A2D3USI0_9PEZI|nr:uncharacterized protein RCC_01465 [Ramularia collo-cygni]CZT15620.1 uncharacterized protein RCC_01465 [Ramularia collo-cygni]
MRKTSTPRGTAIMTELQAPLVYLARDEVYLTEKPYSVEFEIDEDEADGRLQTNYKLETETVRVHAMHDSTQFNLDTNGFCVINAKTTLPVKAALEDPDAVKMAHIEEISTLLYRKFPEYRRLEHIDFVIRKRHEQFPSDRFAKIEHQQPAMLAHSDYSLGGTAMQLEATFPGQEQYFSSREYDLINIWRPLVGPNDDWPLALCDYTSIDLERDIVNGDLIYVERIGENQILHHNKRHRWYYIKGQQPDDIMVFRNEDSTGKRAKAFHCAFNNPESNGTPRQSCEIRFVAFR